tara:strand:- start:2418 stop:4286 length:1869 start_codon:yes stop_codon:yes gene_type:complete
MKQTQNQFYGKKVDLPPKLPPGSTYICSDEDLIYHAREDGVPILFAGSGSSSPNLSNWSTINSAQTLSPGNYIFDMSGGSFTCLLDNTINKEYELADPNFTSEDNPLTIGDGLDTFTDETGTQAAGPYIVSRNSFHFKIVCTASNEYKIIQEPSSLGGSSLFEPNIFRPELLSSNTSQENADLINTAIVSAAGATVTAGSFVVGVKYAIIGVGTTDFTSIGSNSNSAFQEFIATGVGNGTGTAYKIVNGVVVLPAGSFKCRTINYDPRVKLIGAGKRATEIIATDAEPLINYTGDMWYYPAADISEMTLKGGEDNNNRVGTVGINIHSATYFNYSNLMIRWFTNEAVNLTGCLIGQFVSCSFQQNNTGVKAIRDLTTTIGILQSNLVTFQNCAFQENDIWAIDWDEASSIQFTDGCDFEFNGTNGNINTGVIKVTNFSPSLEGTGLIIDKCWGEFNYGTLISIEGNQVGKHSIRDSMFQFGTASQGIDLDGGQLLIDNSTIAFDVDIIDGTLETKSSTIGTVTLTGTSTHKKNTTENLTGTEINLGSVIGTNYNYSSANSSATYTTINSVEGGYATCLINTASEPTVTGGTKISGADFTASTDMELVIEVRNGVVRYFFLNV